MGRLDRYLLSQLVTVFGFFSLILVLVYWINRAVVLFDQLIANGHSAGVFLEFTALTLPNVIRLVAPVSAFAAAIYVANRMAGDSELVVAQSSGVSPWRLLRPVAIFGALAGAAILVLTLALVPVAARILDIRTAEIAQDVTAGLLTEGAFLHPVENVTFYVARITPQGEMRGVFLSDARSPLRDVAYTAQRAVLLRGQAGAQLVMFDGLVQTLGPPTASGAEPIPDPRLSTTRFAEFAFDIGGLMQIGPGGDRRPREVPSLELLAASPALQAETGQSRATLLYTLHERVAQGLFTAIAPMIAFAAMLLGRFSRFGTGRQALVAIVALIGVELLRNLVSAAILNDGLPWALVYAPPMAGLGAALALAGLAARPDLWRARRGVGAA